MAMRSKQNPVGSYVLALLVGSAAMPALGDDACEGFKWDVSKERALFAESAVPLAAGKDRMSAPMVVPNRLYQLQLTPQDHVAFVTPPAKKMLTDGAYAGIAVLKIPASGSYRVSVDVPFWIDVVSDGALVRAKDFQGQRGCSAPHKIVEFELAGAQPFVVQLSGATADSVRLAITPSPLRKP
jgi:hypothetical protein